VKIEFHREQQWLCCGHSHGCRASGCCSGWLSSRARGEHPCPPISNDYCTGSSAGARAMQCTPAEARTNNITELASTGPMKQSIIARAAEVGQGIVFDAGRIVSVHLMSSCVVGDLHPHAKPCDRHQSADTEGLSAARSCLLQRRRASVGLFALVKNGTFLQPGVEFVVHPTSPSTNSRSLSVPTDQFPESCFSVICTQSPEPLRLVPWPRRMSLERERPQFVTEIILPTSVHGGVTALSGACISGTLQFVSLAWMACAHFIRSAVTVHCSLLCIVLELSTHLCRILISTPQIAGHTAADRTRSLPTRNRRPLRHLRIPHPY
jgi:hypothetical protein